MGFRTYVREAIDAPEAILVYLCLYSNIHRIPIGQESTHKEINSIITKLSNDYQRIYTHSHSYTFTKSRYTGKVSSSSAEVSDAYWLVSSINQEDLKKAEEKFAEIEKQLNDMNQRFERIMKAKQNCEKKNEALKNELKACHEKMYYSESLNKKLQAKQLMLNSKKSNPIDLTKEAKLMLHGIADIAKRRAKLFNDIATNFVSLISLNKDKLMLVYMNEKFLREKQQVDNESFQYLNAKAEIEQRIKGLDEEREARKAEAGEFLLAANTINGIKLQSGLPDTYKEQFEKLPNTVELLEDEIHQVEARSECTGEIDQRIIDEYYRRQKEIERLIEIVEKHKRKLKRHQDNFDGLKNEWLTKIDEIVVEINKNFSQLFEQLKCTGEVSLGKHPNSSSLSSSSSFQFNLNFKIGIPENPNEFSKYSIILKVSFRNDEKLQELTAWQQSGGEKSVSTMLYMIALQEMTQCPFRVVDEINQGMDPINERKVFDIIVQNSCAKQFAQYFLLTPKLLPDLSYNEKTNVICVFNGLYNIPHTKYDLKKFIQKRKNLREDD
jgi:structural maintenance of chromosomes protein 5